MGIEEFLSGNSILLPIPQIVNASCTGILQGVSKNGQADYDVG
jgi:hypothetical protein